MKTKFFTLMIITASLLVTASCSQKTKTVEKKIDDLRFVGVCSAEFEQDYTDTLSEVEQVEDFYGMYHCRKDLQACYNGSTYYFDDESYDFFQEGLEDDLKTLAFDFQKNHDAIECDSHSRDEKITTNDFVNTYNDYHNALVTFDNYVAPDKK